MYCEWAREFVELAKFPVRAVVLYVSLSVMLFPYALFCCYLLRAIQQEGSFSFVPSIAFPAAWCATAAAADVASLSPVHFWTMVVLHVLTTTMTLLAAYLFVRVESQHREARLI